MFKRFLGHLTALDVAVTIPGAGFAVSGFFMGRFRDMGDSGSF